MAQITFAKFINNGKHFLYASIFLTFTINAMSSLRWAKFDQLIEFINYIQMASHDKIF
jgi:hypothetical protein